MKNMVHKLIIGLISFGCINIGSLYAVHVLLPNDSVSDPDYHIKSQTIEGKYSLLDVISFVNDYLWVIIGFVCFVFLVWNGINLIMANGDEKKVEGLKKSLIGRGIGLGACLLAAMIVRLTVGLFK